MHICHKIPITWWVGDTNEIDISMADATYNDYGRVDYILNGETFIQVSAVELSTHYIVSV